MFSMICAVGRNNEIGCENKLLWHLPNDLQYFKEKTLNHTVIMGKNTFESIGCALPGRKNIVLALEEDYVAKNCEVCNNLKGLIEKFQDSEEEIFIIGGASIYAQFIPYAEKLYLTKVEDSPKADTFFPDIGEFEKISQSSKKEENGIKYSFCEYARKKNRPKI